VAPHVTAAKTGDTKGIYSPASLESLSAAVHQLVMRQYALYNDVLIDPAGIIHEAA
jgi:polyphosphate kinase